jgi:hypothetical protein
MERGKLSVEFGYSIGKPAAYLLPVDGNPNSTPTAYYPRCVFKMAFHDGFSISIRYQNIMNCLLTIS